MTNAEMVLLVEISTRLKTMEDGMAVILERTNAHQEIEKIQKKRVLKKFSEDQLNLADFIYRTIKKAVDITKPNMREWANTVRLMQEVDGHSSEDICKAITAFSLDPFWSVTCLSPTSLRKNFDRSKVLKASAGESVDQYR